MIANCAGCEADFLYACEYQAHGWHVASTPGLSTIGEKGHFHILMVDDDGEVMVW